MLHIYTCWEAKEITHKIKRVQNRMISYTQCTDYDTLQYDYVYAWGWSNATLQMQHCHFALKGLITVCASSIVFYTWRHPHPHMLKAAKQDIGQRERMIRTSSMNENYVHVLQTVIYHLPQSWKLSICQTHHLLICT